MKMTYKGTDMSAASDRLYRLTEDAIFEHSKARLEAAQEWRRTAPERIREYNRPINRLRRRLTEYRGRIALAIDVLRDRHDCGDDY